MATPTTKEANTHDTQSGAPKSALVEEPGRSTSHHLDGKGLKIAIVSSRWYSKEVVGPLVDACKNELLEKGVASADLTHIEVSGAFEIPFAASRVIQSKRCNVDAVVCIGCMIKGATMVCEFVSEAVTMGIMKLNMKTDTPVVFGVLTCTSEEQAKQCASDSGSCGGGATQRCNHGVQWAQSALEMAHLKRSTAGQSGKGCKCGCHCESQKCSCSCHCTKCDCKTCTCKGECKCSSCCGSKGKEQPMKCTGCDKPGEHCDCKGCNCRVCSQKSG